MSEGHPAGSRLYVEAAQPPGTAYICNVDAGKWGTAGARQQDGGAFQYQADAAICEGDAEGCV